MEIVPISRDPAFEFITKVHRHHRPPQGFKFAVALQRGAELVGVATVGRPVARPLDDGRSAEVTRLCTDGSANACSMLYGACWRAAKAMGYRRLYTYILEDEPGTSLKAAGFVLDGQVAGRSWDTPTRRRTDKHPTTNKQRWVIHR